MAGRVDGAISKLSAWGSRPFREDMDWVNWALFLAFAASVVFLWTRVLGSITEIGGDD
jgi:hypothetical protein